MEHRLPAALDGDLGVGEEALQSGQSLLVGACLNLVGDRLRLSPSLGGIGHVLVSSLDVVEQQHRGPKADHGACDHRDQQPQPKGRRAGEHLGLQAVPHAAQGADLQRIAQLAPQAGDVDVNRPWLR
jgi:hypothetical protein